jgi:hypothetical protein
MLFVLDTFIKLRRSTIASSFLPMRPYRTTRILQHGFSWDMNLSIFRNFVEIIKRRLKSGKCKGHFKWRVHTFMLISCWILLRMRNVPDKICKENQNTKFMLITFFPKSWLLWDNVEKYGRYRQATNENIIRMRFACWAAKTTDAH